MLLSDLVDKKVCSGKTVRGVCRGVGISSKNFAVKYLLCSEGNGGASNADFSVNITSVEKIGEEIFLSRLRPVYPKNCVKLFLGQPVYTNEGAYLGKVSDVELQQLVATRIYTDRDTVYSVLSVVACSDAVILRKEQPFPLGQRIPAPIVSMISEKNEAVVTKPLLRGAIQKGMLVRLTLSLPPFDCDLVEFPKAKRHFFF